MICVRNLSHQIGNSLILNDISVDIPQGKVTALVGPNGQVTVGPLTVGACSNRELAKYLSILPQMPDQVPRLTIRELVSFGRYPYHQGRPNPQERQKVDAALNVFGLAEFANRPIAALSGGQRQRAQIAMIFAQDTDYMLLDEPLNNLDIAGARSLMALLRQLSDQHGKTIVIVLHDINVASRYADWLVAMDAGRIVAQGPPKQTVTPQFLRDVFRTDADIHHIDDVPVVLV
ncbi:ATP-binding cassette domain-containing protein [Aestuariibius sp. HNIBRBA575]|uniref:ATP-binding cassette domain-containing protein n=1 Tax=Aestuariibius sp. HNIBRBA575 TaxID=3233343 RepID=UPI0034A54105